MIIKSGFNVVISASALILTASSVCKLIYFMSHVSTASEIAFQKQMYNEKGGFTQPSVLHTVWAVTVNTLLLSIFILQHSGMANASVKEKLHNIGLKVVERSLYIISTSIALLLLIHFWHSTPWITIWHIDTNKHQIIGWLFTLTHAITWFLILAETFLSDMFEFIGIKQVYNDICGYEAPLASKSPDLCRLYSHVRHSSFICFGILFWVQPLMSIDKLLLAIYWTIYMAFAWSVDSQDLMYIEKRFRSTKLAFSIKRQGFKSHNFLR